MNEVVAVSGLLQATLGVWMGWGMMAFHSGAERLGPIRSLQRLKQAHLDNLFMGALQLGIAAINTTLPTVPAVLLIFGSWTNAQLFFLQSMVPEVTLRKPWARWLAMPSALALTIAYPWLAYLATT